VTSGHEANSQSVASFQQDVQWSQRNIELGDHSLLYTSGKVEQRKPSLSSTHDDYEMSMLEDLERRQRELLDMEDSFKDEFGTSLGKSVGDSIQDSKGNWASEMELLQQPYHLNRQTASQASTSNRPIGSIKYEPHEESETLCHQATHHGTYHNIENDLFLRKDLERELLNEALSSSISSIKAHVKHHSGRNGGATASRYDDLIPSTLRVPEIRQMSTLASPMKPSPVAATADESLDLVFNPILNSYYDPRSGLHNSY
jgi:hypothetical protein